MLDRPPRPTPASAGDAGDAPPPGDPAREARRARARALARRGGAVLAAWTLVGLAQALVWRFSGKELIEPGTFLNPTALQMLAAAWTWAALTPVLVWLTRRLAQPPARAAVVIAGHVAGVLFTAVVVTAARVGTIHLLGLSAWAPRQFVFWLDINVATYLLVAAGVRAVDLHRGYAARMRRAIRLEAQLARARLQFLQRQLQPHFLFNCLNATAELTREAPEAAQRMLGHLERLLRAALEHAGDGEVTLRAELAALEPYVEIQRTRFGDAFDFAAHAAPSALDARVPSLLLQPLVENAFQHGLAGRDHGRVRVRAAVWPTGGHPRLRIEVADDGTGAPVRTDAHAVTNGRAARGSRSGARRTGIGLRNTRDRLRQLYGDDFTFELRQTPGTGTVVLLEIPYRPAGADEAEPDTRFDTAEYAAVTAAAARVAEARAVEARAVEARAMETRAVGPSTGATDAFAGLPDVWPAIGANGATNGATNGVATNGARPAEPWRSGAFAPVTLATTGVSGATPETTSAFAAASPARGGRRAWLRLGALWLCAAAFWTLQIWALDLVEDGSISDWLGSRRDALGALEWALLTPVVLWLARRFRLTRRTWKRLLPLHLAFAAVIDVAQVAGMWRAFDPQLSPFSWLFVSPLTVNFLIYSALVAWAHARDFGGWLQDRELADARLEAALAHARWQALTLELRPQLVLTVLRVAARLAPEDPPRAERLIERLSDLLRAVLEASSAAAAQQPTATTGEFGNAPEWQAQALRHELSVFGACAELLTEAVGHQAHVSLDADPTALDAPVPPGAFGPLLDALVDALLVEADLAEVAAPAVLGAGASYAPIPSGPIPSGPIPSGPYAAVAGRLTAREAGPLRLGVLARATPSGVRVTVSADAPLFAHAPTPSGAYGPPLGTAPTFPDAYTAVLDLPPDGGLGALTPVSGIAAASPSRAAR